MADALIPRDVLERVIKRAAELQAGERDVGEELTRDELLALGQEVGIPAKYLKQALLEEQTRAPVARGPWAWLAGPTRLPAERVVPGDKAAVERALAAWMEQEESLQVKRRFPDGASWEPKTGFLAAMRRGLGAGGRTFALARAREVSGVVTQLESGFCHVRLQADIRNLRNERIGWGATGLALGGAAAWTAGLVSVLTPIGWAAAGVLGVSSLYLLLTAPRDNERVQVALEQVLDRLERGEIRAAHALPGPRPGALGRIADEILKSFHL